MSAPDLGAELTQLMLRAQRFLANTADERAALWVEAAAAGATTAQIAAACGVSQNTVWRELRRARAS